MENDIRITGVIKESQVVYTTDSGEKFYKMFVEVPRLSGTVDVLPVIGSEKVFYDASVEVGTTVFIEGQIRTRNIIDDKGKSHLNVYCYALNAGLSDPEVEPDPQDRNFVNLEGYICREVRSRTTKKTNRPITDIMIAIKRNKLKSDYIPCIACAKSKLFNREAAA